jgi:8-oxo-dGTP pyrophosphatase MutT (NUDIX family)
MRWGRAGAGALVVACTTGRVLLVLRSQDVTEPGTWGLPGGKIEPSEKPMPAAIRELREETRFRGELLFFPSFVFREEGFVFYNFFALAKDEFKPKLDWENDDAQWFELDQLPEPLHFGVERLLDEAGHEIPGLIEQCASSF